MTEATEQMHPPHRCLGYFHILAIMDNAAKNVGM